MSAVQPASALCQPSARALHCRGCSPQRWCSPPCPDRQIDSPKLTGLSGEFGPPLPSNRPPTCDSGLWKINNCNDFLYKPSGLHFHQRGHPIFLRICRLTKQRHHVHVVVVASLGGCANFERIFHFVVVIQVDNVRVANVEFLFEFVGNLLLVLVVARGGGTQWFAQNQQMVK